MYFLVRVPFPPTCKDPPPRVVSVPGDVVLGEQPPRVLLTRPPHPLPLLPRHSGTPCDYCISGVLVGSLVAHKTAEEAALGSIPIYILVKRPKDRCFVKNVKNVRGKVGNDCVLLKFED